MKMSGIFMAMTFFWEVKNEYKILWCTEKIIIKEIKNEF